MEKINKSEQNLKDFVTGYVNCLYWVEDSGGTKNEEKLSTEAFLISVLECNRFLANAKTYTGGLIPENCFEQAGHDFYLTRNGHGSGFWDKPEIYGEKYSKILTEISKNFGEASPYVSDDGEIEIM